jgi:hypothetical protein
MKKPCFALPGLDVERLTRKRPRLPFRDALATTKRTHALEFSCLYKTPTHG